MKKLSCVDIKKEHLQAPARGGKYGHLAQGSAAEGVRAILKAPLYGTSDAARNRGEKFVEALRAIGFVVGKLSPCLSWGGMRFPRLVIHGDDVTAVRGDGVLY